MHRLNDSLFSSGPVTTQHLDSWGGLLMVAAVVLASFGIVLAGQAYFRSRNLRFSWRTFGVLLASLVWLLPIASILMLFGMYFVVRFQPMRSDRASISHLNRIHFVRDSIRQAGQRLSRVIHRRDPSPKYVAVGGTNLWTSRPTPLAEAVDKDSKATAASQPTEIATDGDAKATASVTPDRDPSLPDWVSKSDAVEQPGNRQLVVISTELEGSREEAEAKALNAAAALVGADLATAFPDVRGWQPEPETVRSEAVRLIHVAPIHRKTISSGVPFDVYRAYCQVELSPAVRTHLLAHWKDEVVSGRIAALGGLAGLLTLTFGTVAAYFRLDSRTSGHYRRRLKLAAISIIAAGGVAAAVLI